MKPPSFPFYARDFYVGTSALPSAAIGIYIRALAWSWDNGPLPLDLDATRKLLFCDTAEFRKNWPIVANKLTKTPNGYVNDRLESERNKVSEYMHRQSKRGSAGAEKRWHKHGHGDGASIAGAIAEPFENHSLSLSLALADPDQRTKRANPAPAKNAGGVEPPLAAPPTPALLTFPVIGAGPKEWHLTASYVAELSGDYPGLDVLGECRSARAWCVANPAKRKTAKGLPAFLVNWLNRAVNSGGQRLALVPSRQPERPALGAWRDECERVHGGTQGNYCGTQAMHVARMAHS